MMKYVRTQEGRDGLFLWGIIAIITKVGGLFFNTLYSAYFLKKIYNGTAYILVRFILVCVCISGFSFLLW